MAPFMARTVPFVTNCEAWRQTPILASTTPPASSNSPATALSTQASLAVPAAPVARPHGSTDANQEAQPATTPTAQASPSNANRDSAHEPQKPLAGKASTPLKLARADYCDWYRPSFTEECTDTTETGSYYGWIDQDTPWRGKRERPPANQNKPKSSLLSGIALSTSRSARQPSHPTKLAANASQ
jgi:type VI secretion system secreted protein VgrG